MPISAVLFVLASALLSGMAGIGSARCSAVGGSLAALSPIPPRSITFTGGFWKQRQDANRAGTVWANIEQCERTGRLGNFDEAARVLAGGSGGTYRGLVFNDSDVYKVIEGAAYILASVDDRRLRETCDGIVGRIVAAQHADGYLNTHFTVKAPERRWSAIEHDHELYCGGHLIEAGIAYFEATGDRRLLDAGIRFADLVDSIFGPGKRHAVPGHQEIEVALIRLWRVTGDDRYLALARYFLDARGHTSGRGSTGEYSQDHLPVREQDQVVGHAVRAVYMWMAVADLLGIVPDEGYRRAMDDVWHDLTNRKTYVTGGIGPSAHNEGFTTPYDLPNDTAYAETCAGIGSVMWNDRLGRLYADGSYYDAAERALYNGVLSGVSLGGERFFYVNPLLSRGNHQRRDWYECACCPPNILRLVANAGTMFYSVAKAQDPGSASAGSGVRDQVRVNLYNESVARFEGIGSGNGDPGRRITITQTTEYPWDGRVALAVSVGAGEEAVPAEFDLFVRVPGWAGRVSVTVNGRSVEPAVTRGYALVGSAWRDGDRVELDFPMEIERVRSNPLVKSNAGLVALRRGPMVYAVESVDNEADVLSLAVPPGESLAARWRADLLGGVMVIEGNGLVPDGEHGAGSGGHGPWGWELYRAAPKVRRAAFTAIPYFAWSNRGPSTMAVWLPESVGIADEGPSGTYRFSASYHWPADRPGSMREGAEPTSSGDHEIPRLTFWPRKGTDEWVAIEFDRPRVVSGVEVYWFDDTGRGGCRLPESWRVSVRSGGEWVAIGSGSGFPVVRDGYSVSSFPAVRAEAVRVEVRLVEGGSG
ncbi:MAG: glycoside hydrolase family 127 protein, partial [Phycisphaeraceae bacterium]|nr:glycoside hydrolase family 127 protein [Phycisphaeraceae bacterium]